jgi:glutamate/tyrosine decarboxylase-like PLP-dependent enzyme
MARTAPGEIKARLPAQPPETSEPFDNILRDLDDIVMPGLSHWTHPKFFGYFPSNGELSSVLGDFASTGLGVLGLRGSRSPALTEIEEVATDWLRQMIGLPPGWQGVIQDTASNSTLTALLCARERTSGTAFRAAACKPSRPRSVVYGSAQRTARWRRPPARRVRPRQSAADSDGSAVGHAADALARAIEEDMAAGRTPCAIVATTGTTTTTAIDPIDRIAAIAQAHGLWLHVDAAMAGSAMILPSAAIYGAASSTRLHRRQARTNGSAPRSMRGLFCPAAGGVGAGDVDESQLPAIGADSVVKNYRDWGLPAGAPVSGALKLWFLIRSQGVTGLQARLRRDIANARWLAGEIGRAPQWRVLNPVVLADAVCAARTRKPARRAARSAHAGWCDRLNRSGEGLPDPCPARRTLDGARVDRVDPRLERPHWRSFGRPCSSGRARW